ncbi:MAG: cysteine--tRNA ligase [Pseudomonadota bacterium]|nr:cysteine--tRNA ligase [Pseudomonadota bacterium]
MTLRIHDTLSREKVDFVAHDAGHVRIYVCGPTVYDYAHIGNARPVVVFDVLVRLLRRLYPKVTYVRNITDIDDKINNAARETGEDISSITMRTTEAFHGDMAALGALPPDVEPRATDYVEEMQVMIEDLIARGHAYEAEEHVLFNVPSMPEYGRLSRLDTREIIAGARVDVVPYKRDPQDFVLWKPSDAETPGWDSPWGRGRPGWHIECSVMSAKHLGDSFDIHGGGQDLIFPHHENEIAQSLSAQGTGTFAKYWMHNGYLMAEGEKMSKSLGNFYTVHELLDEFPGEAIRLLLLKTHYRQPLDFTKGGLRKAKLELDRFYGVLRSFDNFRASGDEIPPGIIAALGDDLNTPLALSELHEIAGLMNKSGGVNKAAAKEQLLAAGEVLGLLQQDPENWFRWQPKATEGGPDDEAIETLIAERTKARANKDFARADDIRDRLAADNVFLEDSTGTTIWRRS